MAPLREKNQNKKTVRWILMKFAVNMRNGHFQTCAKLQAPDFVRLARIERKRKHAQGPIL